jgi:hypothetical protein
VIVLGAIFLLSDKYGGGRHLDRVEVQAIRLPWLILASDKQFRRHFEKLAQSFGLRFANRPLAVHDF